MLRYVYKVIILSAIFIGSFYIMSRNIAVVSTPTKQETVEMADSVFPVLYLKTGEHTINPLYGYSSNIDTREVRESITALDIDKTFSVIIEENASNIKRLEYEIRSIADNALLDSNGYTAFEKNEGNRSIQIKLDTTLDTSTEYGLKFTVTTNSSKKIHYYTRIKYYESDFYLTEKLDFINTFHNNTLTKENPTDVTTYLEPDNDTPDTSFANVTIKSSYDTVTWGNMQPEVLTDIIPTIKEINIETAAITLDYYVRAETATAKEIFRVREYYRVRYDTNQFYLLYFQRTMEAVFDPNLISLSKADFKLGITNETNIQVVSTDNSKKVAFVRDGSLWYYNLSKNILTRIFSFDPKDKINTRPFYDQHNIRILKMDDAGNISFIVYGYMNRGDYEGRVAILLYDYDAEKDTIQERVYIPLTTTYQKLQHDLGSFSYVNDKNIFYFSLNNIVYAYNIASKKITVLVDNITDSNFVMLQDSKCFAWMDTTSAETAKTITILNLETEETQIISAGDNENIGLLGTIEDNIVFGYVKSSDIKESTDGNVLTPYYRLQIIASDGTILKDYQKRNRYIKSVNIEENVIHMKILKKDGDSFENASDDSILNNEMVNTNQPTISTRVTELAMTEYYLSMPAGFTMEKLPENLYSRNIVITEDTTLHINEKELDAGKYYVYAYGGITASTDTAADAIALADEQMGVVLDNNSLLIWERGGKFKAKTISGIEPAYVETSVTSIGACLSMMLQANQMTVKASELSGNKSITKKLSKYVEQPVNLTGCTLDEVLYFVSSGRPVLAMRSKDLAVLIIGYTETGVTYIDPSAMATYTVSLANGTEIFEQAGNSFVSYVK